MPAASLAAESALADRVSQLEATVAALQAENRELRKRVDKLEPRPQASAPSQPVPAPNPGWKDKANWRRLRRGMTEGEVEALLGPPDKVDIGLHLGYWLYSPTQGVLGPNVMFEPKDMTVYGWKEP
jgi:hypothetical protein